MTPTQKCSHKNLTMISHNFRKIYFLMKFSESNKCIVHSEYKTVVDVGKDAGRHGVHFPLKALPPSP